MMRPPPRFTDGHTASISARQWREIVSRFDNGSASILSSGIGAGAAAAGASSGAFRFSTFGAAALGGGGAAFFGAGVAAGGGGGAAAAGGGAAAAGGGAVFAAGGGGGGGAGGAVAAGGGVTACTALAQAGDSLAMCWRKQSRASLPPRGTPEQFDRKSERQLPRMALCCSALIWAKVPALKAARASVATASRRTRGARFRGSSMIFPLFRFFGLF